MLGSLYARLISDVSDCFGRLLWPLALAALLWLLVLPAGFACSPSDALLACYL